MVLGVHRTVLVVTMVLVMQRGVVSVMVVGLVSIVIKVMLYAIPTTLSRAGL